MEKWKKESLHCHNDLAIHFVMVHVKKGLRATTVQLIGSKWKLLILRNLLQRPWRFNELRKNLEGISQKVLTDSLRSNRHSRCFLREAPVCCFLYYRARASFPRASAVIIAA